MPKAKIELLDQKEEDIPIMSITLANNQGGQKITIPKIAAEHLKSKVGQRVLVLNAEMDGEPVAVVAIHKIRS